MFQYTMRLIVGAVSLLVSASAAWAAGSVISTEYAPLLAQRKEIHDFVSAYLDLDESGSGDRIGQAVNPTLGGTRIAPFFIKAKPRGEKRWTLLLEIQAEVDFLDADGNRTDLVDAISVRQTLTGIKLTPLAE